MSEIKHKGLIIQLKYSPVHKTPYYIILNPFKSINKFKVHHTHARSVLSAKRVIDCYIKLKYNGYTKGFSRVERNKAMALDGMKIYFK